MAGARLQPARAQPPPRRPCGRRERLAGRPHRAAGRRALHGRGRLDFAFGRDVLPVDTNVRRVQERTGELFDASCAQALFDLGATICLARVPRCGSCPLSEACPSRGSRYQPLRKQSRFEGSFRQRRAAALRAAAAGHDPEDDEAVAALVRDGLLTAEGVLPT